MCRPHHIVLALGLVARVSVAESGLDESGLVAGTDARILTNRTAPLTIEVFDAQGLRSCDIEVVVEHVRHRFLFGAGFDTQLLRELAALGTFRTDAQGRAEIPNAYEGSYRVGVGDASKTGEHRNRTRSSLSSDARGSF